MREKSKRCWAVRPDSGKIQTPDFRRVLGFACIALLFFSLLSCLSSPKKNEPAPENSETSAAQPPATATQPTATKPNDSQSTQTAAGTGESQSTAATSSAATLTEKDATTVDEPEPYTLEPGTLASSTLASSTLEKGSTDTETGTGGTGTREARPILPLPEMGSILEAADAKLKAGALALAERDLFPPPAPARQEDAPASPLSAGKDLFTAVDVPDPVVADPAAAPSPDTTTGLAASSSSAAGSYGDRQPEISTGSVSPYAGTKSDVPSTAGVAPREITQKPPLLSRKMNARLGDVLTISMDGKGWLFLGEKSGAGGVDFLSRTTDEKTSLFIFNTIATGEYTLLFEYRDFISGASTSEEVLVTVEQDPRAVRTGASAGNTTAESALATGAAAPGTILPTVASASASGSAPVSEKTVTAPPQSLELKKLADRFIADGRLNDALNLYLDHDKTGDPETALAIGDLYLRLGDPAKALQYYDRNKTQANLLYREKAVAGLMKIALAERKQNLVDSNLEAFLSISKVPIGEELKDLASFQLSQGYDASALKILESYILKYPEGKDADWVYFTLANLYETSEKLKDYRKSVTHYRKVADDFPMSLYWNDAKNRILYIERHFFNIR